MLIHRCVKFCWFVLFCFVAIMRKKDKALLKRVVLEMGIDRDTALPTDQGQLKQRGFGNLLREREAAVMSSVSRSLCRHAR